MNELNSMILNLIVHIAVGGFIGWITNLIAIKALFHPYEEMRLLGFKYQGLIPKRKGELAENLGRMVEDELINVQEIVDKVKKEDVDAFIESQVDLHKEDISLTIREYIENCIKRNQSLVDKVSGVAKVFGVSVDAHKENAILGLTDSACKEIKIKSKNALPKIIDTVGFEIAKKISIKKITEEKVNAMDLVKLESMVYRIANKEMKMIEYLGGILGAIVGAMQWGVQCLFF